MKTLSTKLNKLTLVFLSLFMSFQLGCKKEDPLIPGTTPSPTSTSEVHILEGSSLSNLTSYSGATGEIKFNNSVDYKAGDILVPNELSDKAPFGFLRKITSISGDGKTLLTKQATLEEAIENGGFYFKKQLKPEKNYNWNLKPGVKFSGGTKDFDFDFTLTDFVIFDEDGSPATTNDQILANGSINFNYTLIDSLWIKNFKLKYFEFKNVVSVSSEIEVTYTFSSNNIYKEKTLGDPYQFPTFLAGVIMGIPVYVTPYLEIIIGTDGKVSISTSKVTQQTTLEGGVKYENEDWTLIKTFDNEFTYENPSLNFEIEAKTFAGPRLTMMIYDIAGPYGQVDCYLELEAHNKTLYWELSAGLDVKIGVKVEVISVTLVDTNWMLIDFNKSLASGEIGGGSGNSCPGIPTITYQGQTYNTVLIGEQCWLKENMNYETGNSWCYANNQTNCETYGRLYDWETALGVCPSGWHLPTDEEWKILEGTVDGQYSVGDPEWDQAGWRGLDVGKNLKSNSGWSSNGNGLDLFGFSVLPGGYGIGSYFDFLGEIGYFWSSTPYDNQKAWERIFNFENDKSFRGNFDKAWARSVRCLKD